MSVLPDSGRRPPRLRLVGVVEGLCLIREANGETVLSGPIVDEAALHGWLKCETWACRCSRESSPDYNKVYRVPEQGRRD